MKTWMIPIFWDGRAYKDISKLDGIVASKDELPPDPSSHIGQVWGVPNGKDISHPDIDLDLVRGIAYDLYFYNVDKEEWDEVVWLFDIYGRCNIPYPGVKVGACHRLILYDVPVFWDGYVWRQHRHSNLDNDEPEKHLPSGFISLVPADVELVYVSKSLMALRKVKGGSGKFWLGGYLVEPDSTTILTNNYPVVNYDGGKIVISPIQKNTEYWVYIAHPFEDIFDIKDSIPESQEHKGYNPVNLKGRLFLSNISPVEDAWGESELSRLARFVGRIQTDNSSKEEGGPFFKHELNISWISRKASLSEAFRDYSDYYIEYGDHEHIYLKLMDGYHGQIYVPEELIYFGMDYEIGINDPWVSIDPDTDEPIIHTDGGLLPNTEYFIYIVNDVDAVNFNAINEKTGRPWGPFDADSATKYNPKLDLRLKPFLCTKPHDHYRLTESWPLFYSRCLGHIWTDANGYFLYSKDISYIKSLNLNPTHLKGLADFSVKALSDEHFGIVQTPGTAGVVYVGGQTIFTLPETYNDIHQLNVNDYVFVYNESNLTNPLSALDKIVDHKNTQMYVYLANNDPAWGERKNKLFATLTSHTNGYLSSNYPGSCARWVATIKTDKDGKLTGSWLIDSPGDQTGVYGYLADFYNSLNDVVYDISDITDSLWSHGSMIDYLLGLGSDFELELNSYVSDLRSDVSALREDLDATTSNYSDIVNITDDLCGITVSLSNEISTIDHLIDSLSADINEANLHVSMLGSEIDLTGHNLDSLSTALSDVASDVEAVQNIVSGMDSVILDMSGNISGIRIDVDSLSLVTSGIIGELNSFKADISHTSSGLEDASNELVSLYSNISGIQTEVNDIFVALSRVGSDVDELYSFKSLFTQEVWDLLSDTNAISGIVDSLELWRSYVDNTLQSMESVVEEVTAIESRLNSDHGDILNIYSLLDSNQQALRQETEMLINLQLLLEVRESALRSDYYVMSSIQNSMEEDIVNLYSDTSALNNIASLLSNDIQGLFQEINILYSLSSGLESDLGDLSGWLLELGSDFGGLTYAIDALSASTSLNMSEVYSWLQEVSGDISAVWDEFGGLSQYVDGISNVADSLKSYAIDISQHVSMLGSQLYILSGDINDQSLYASMLESQLNVMGDDLDIQSQLIYSLGVVASNIDNRVNQQSLLLDILNSDLDVLGRDLDSHSNLISSLTSLEHNLSTAVSAQNDLYILLSYKQDILSADLSDLQSLEDLLGNRLSNLSGGVVALSLYTYSLSQYTSLLSSNVNSLSNTLSGVGLLVDNMSLRVSNISNYTLNLSLITSDLSLRANSLSYNISQLSSLN
ncbi:MAG: hypothetical protein ACP5RW_09315, partial [bacterium]